MFNKILYSFKNYAVEEYSNIWKNIHDIYLLNEKADFRTAWEIIILFVEEVQLSMKNVGSGNAKI